MRQDFHLAKRFYDQAAEVDSKARAPRDIALLMLEVHPFMFFWVLRMVQGCISCIASFQDCVK